MPTVKKQVNRDEVWKRIQNNSATEEDRNNFFGTISAPKEKSVGEKLYSFFANDIRHWWNEFNTIEATSRRVNAAAAANKFINATASAASLIPVTQAVSVPVAFTSGLVDTMPRVTNWLLTPPNQRSKIGIGNFFDGTFTVNDIAEQIGRSDVTQAIPVVGNAIDKALDYYGILGNVLAAKDYYNPFGAVTIDNYKKTMKKEKYAMGGKVPIEAEGKEFLQLPGGQGTQIQGPSHGEGGINLNVPQGTQIFSNKIQIDGKSLADRAKDRERFKKRFAKNPTDELKKNSLSRILEQEKLDIAITNVIQKRNKPGEAKYGYVNGRFTYIPDDPGTFGLTNVGENQYIIPGLPTTSSSNPFNDAVAARKSVVASTIGASPVPPGMSSGQYYQSPEVMNNLALFDPLGASSTPGLTNNGTEIALTANNIDLNKAIPGGEGKGGNNTSWTDAMGGGAGMIGMGFQIGSSIGQLIAQAANHRAMLKTIKGMNHDNWTDFGNWELQERNKNEELAHRNREYAINTANRELGFQTRSALDNANRSTMSLNTNRAIRQATQSNADRNWMNTLGNINNNFGQTLMQLGEQKAQAVGNIDRTRRTAQDQYDATNRDIAGDYFTANSALWSDVGQIGRDFGKTMQGTASNYQALKYMGEMNPYFNYGFGGLYNKPLYQK
jgi:hypothetical protein